MGPSLGPPIQWLRVKRPGFEDDHLLPPGVEAKMDVAINLLPTYAFVASTETALPVTLLAVLVFALFCAILYYLPLLPEETQFVNHPANLQPMLTVHHHWAFYLFIRVCFGQQHCQCTAR